ncbi:hypothetical protein BOTBODRAFT_177147 [Botryobasidium botryosum FD-172 SS1]|uniref:NAD-dependent epimerase/dehydratase domain-containing protein n=1 Tax=Botryobasidium botryosum (strain FD-172 SS1) TaxID=930990 RepID=A0A067MI02_BOTB1|nr:hypothetical protein BOTBODRAFT_177147 [Botryobasidium botryosum FD-172 SS1]
MPSVFLVGVGFIGGSLLVALKREYPDLEVTALVNSYYDFDAIREAGATPIHADRYSEVATFSENADVVINAASSDDLPLTDAILRGMKSRHDSGRGTGVLIHTSGTMLFSDNVSNGTFDPYARIWDDTKEEDIRALTTSMPHGHVDVPVLKAGDEGYVHTYIVTPSNVYGHQFGPLWRDPVIYRFFVTPSIRRGYSIYVGEGSNVYETIHVNDLIDIYLRVFKLSLEGPPKTNAYQRYFIATARRHSWKDVMTSIGDALYDQGHIKTPGAQSVSFQEAGRLARFMASNCNCLAKRAAELGWAPKEKSYVEAIGLDIEEALAREGSL